VELVDVSSFFDRTPVLDADSGVQLFLAQLQNYDGSHRDNVTAYRRILSVAPGTVIPASRAVSALGKTWLVGRDSPDGQATAHRVKYVVQSAPAKASVYTAAAFLTGAGAASIWADLQWSADRKELAVSSRVPQEYTAFLPSTAAVGRHSFIVLGSQCLMVQSVAASPAGFLEAQGMLQGAAAASTAVITPRTYSSTTGAYTNGAPVTVACAIVRWQEFYEYAGQSDDKYQEGDAVLLLPSSASVAVSSAIVSGGTTWTVLSARVESGVLAVHGRPR
jgi:hypothetical protein